MGCIGVGVPLLSLDGERANGVARADAAVEDVCERDDLKVGEYMEVGNKVFIPDTPAKARAAVDAGDIPKIVSPLPTHVLLSLRNERWHLV